MIVVTGATGKLGQMVVDQLASRVPVSELAVSVRNASKAASISDRGIRVRQGDFADPKTLPHAFEGASVLLIISSNARAFGGDPLAEHQAAIDAAKEAGVQRIFYTSQIASSPNSAFSPARDHAATEVMLEESGVLWTALRNGFYADAASMFMGREWQDGRIDAPADGKVSWTAHSDLAAAAAVLLTGAMTLNGPTPPLIGSEALDLADLASIGSSVIGSPVTRQVMADEDFQEQARQRGLPEGYVRIALGYYEASRRGEFSGVDGTLEALIGRPPRTMRAILEESIQRA